MIKLLIVDDSAFVRYAIARMVKSESGIEIVGTARDGLEALDKIKELKPDVITMDVEMPRMSGLQALERVMAESPTSVIMVSSLTGPGATATIRALELGAVDFFLKASSANPLGTSGSPEELISKIKMAASLDKQAVANLSIMGKLVARTKPVNRPNSGIPRQVVIIASSTGGPRALYQVVPELPEDLPAAVLIVQHMPAGFTKTLADRLDETSHISIKEAEDGSVFSEGTALLAPGGFHMVLGNRNNVCLNQTPSVLGLRPAADVTMLSMAKAYGKKAVVVVLTGMGSDGTNGAAAIKAEGGIIIAQEASTCVVYGMPASVVQAGLANYIVPLPQVAETITRICKSR
jgi:two-component system chemotaxis response regulator CheB